MAGAYCGQSLDETQKQIRVVDISPGRANGPIICSSRVVSIPTSCPYTALSYHWGDRNDRLSIRFNNQSDFQVTRNLHIALSYLRDEENPVTLWVDALCINQADEGEKKSQIPIMGSIYKMAKQTCIWLGEESSDSDRAMEIISKLDGEDLSSTCNSPGVSGLEAIQALQKRPWWSRVWVIQEALLSAKPIVRCGNKSLPIEDFIRLNDIRRGWNRATPSSTWNLDIENGINQSSAALTNPFSAILTYWESSRADIEAGRSRLGHWVGWVDGFHASDPRDMVYGLVGFGSDADRRWMKTALDQKMTASQVYSHTTTWFIGTMRSLAPIIIDFDNRAPRPVGEEGNDGAPLPSWVPDYSRPHRGVSYLHPDEPYAVNGDGSLISAEIQGTPFREVLQVPSLHLRALVVDSIAFASGNPYRKGYDGLDASARTKSAMARLQVTAEKVAAWEREALQPGWEGRYFNTLEAFRRTMTNNRDGKGRHLDYDGHGWDRRFDIFLGRQEAPPDVDTEEDLLQFLLPLRLAVLPRINGRSFFITTKGFFGNGPLKSRPGDEICILEGSQHILYLVRPVARDELASYDISPVKKQRFFRLVGEAYVHGVSDGEWINVQCEDDVIEAVII
ncbi:hypothetical protein OQA88_10302 [Cercophora sp. LCS_1]